MTHALHGRGDHKQMLQTRICLDHPEVPNAHEFLASFKQPLRDGDKKLEAMRQGSVEMTIYNMRQLSPLYVRPLDANDADLCDKIVKEYERARKMSVDEYRKDLQKRGLFVAGPNGASGKRETAPAASK